MPSPEPHYLRNVLNDFDRMGLVTDLKRDVLDSTPDYKWDWSRAGMLLHATKEISPRLQYKSNQETPWLATAFAKRVLEVLKLRQVPVFGGVQLDCCAEAEPKLAHSMFPEAGANRHLAKPVIITKQEEPVAILKTFGENSLYALETDLELGLIKGAFSEPARPWRFDNLPRSTKPWRMDAAGLKSARPIRFGGFLLPPSARSILAIYTSDGFELPALGITHSQLQQEAARQLANAIPVDLQLVR